MTYKRYECKRCLRKFGLKNMVMIRASLPSRNDDFDLCLTCYTELIEDKVDPKCNPFVRLKKIKKLLESK